MYGTISHTGKYGAINNNEPCGKINASSIYGGVSKTDVNGKISSIPVCGSLSFPDVINGINYDDDLVTYMTGLTAALSTTQKYNLNTFITTLKTGLGITNISDAFDILYVLAGETQESSLRNLASRNYDGILYGTSTFQQYEGFTLGSGRRIIPNVYTPFNNGNTYTLNSAAVGEYIRTGTNVTVTMEVISCYTGASYTYHRFYSNTSTRGAINCLNMTSKTISSQPGLWAITRLNSNTTHIYQNGIWIGTYTYTPTALPNTTMIFGASYTGQLSLIYVGRGFTGAQSEILKNAFESYLNAWGKGVL